MPHRRTLRHQLAKSVFFSVGLICRPSGFECAPDGVLFVLAWFHTGNGEIKVLGEELFWPPTFDAVVMVYWGESPQWNSFDLVRSKSFQVFDQDFKPLFLLRGFWL